MKKLIIIGIIALLVCVGLSGCEQTAVKGDDEKFIGTWICYQTLFNTTIIFTQNHTYQSTQPLWNDGIYEVKDGELFLAVSNTNIVFSFDYIFSENDWMLTLSTAPGSNVTYLKQS